MWQAGKCIHIVYESGICSNMIYGTLSTIIYCHFETMRLGADTQ